MSDTDHDQLAELLGQHIEEAVALRMGAELPVAASSLGGLLESLLDIRRRLDRLEELYGSVVRLRAHTQRVHAACKMEAEEAWDVAAVKQRSAAARDEYSSARERAAAANLEVLDLRRVERAADRNARLCDEALEFVRLRYNGLSGLRQDLLALVRAIQFESALDR